MTRSRLNLVNSGTFGPFHPAWEETLERRRRVRSPEYLVAWLRKQGWSLSYRAVVNGLARYDRAVAKEKQRRLASLTPDRLEALKRSLWEPAALATELLASGLGRTEPPDGWDAQQVSRPQAKLQRLLEDAGYRVEPERPFGPYRVDCYLPERRIAFECDGVYWHGGKVAKAKDTRRDRILLERYGVVTVRITDEEINRWPT